MTTEPPAPEPVHYRFPDPGEAITNAGVNYFIGPTVGQGYYGIVYDCTDEWGNELVAKVLKPMGTFSEIADRWQREAALLTTMRHPNITYIHDAFVYRNLFYLVIEKCLYPLSAALHHASELWLPQMARDVLQALAYIHRAGWVHKDVHVGNVFVSATKDRFDEAREPVIGFKLGDFGISRMEGSIRPHGSELARWMLPPEAIDPASKPVLERLRGHEVEAALVAEPIPFRDLEARPVFTESLVLVAPEDYPPLDDPGPWTAAR